MSGGGGKTHHAPGADRVAVPLRVERWRQAWQGNDADAVAALYCPDATHASPLVAARMAKLGRGHLVGRTEIRAYAAQAFAMVQDLRFEIWEIISDGRRDAVEYRRFSSLDKAGPKQVMEVLEWREELLSAVRVYHF